MKIMTIVPFLFAFFVANAVAQDCETENKSESFLDIHWTPPEEFESGKPLDVKDDITGYEIYVDRDGKWTKIAGASSRVTGCRLYLEEGPHDLAMKTIAGREASQFSNSVQKTAELSPKRGRLSIE